MAVHEAKIVMEEVTDTAELAKARAQDGRFERNFAWFQAHAGEIFTRYRAKCIVIAGQELFVADTPEEAWALAQARHQDDDGALIHYIPKENVARIYAHRRRVGEEVCLPWEVCRHHRTWAA